MATFLRATAAASPAMPAPTTNMVSLVEPKSVIWPPARGTPHDQNDLARSEEARLGLADRNFSTDSLRIKINVESQALPRLWEPQNCCVLRLIVQRPPHY